MHVILKVTKPYFFHKLPKVTNQTFTKNKYYKSPLKKKHRFLPGYYPSKMAGMVEGCEPSTHGLPKGDLTKMVMFPSKRQGHTTTGCWQPSNGTHSLEKCTRRVQNTGGNLAFGYSKNQGNYMATWHPLWKGLNSFGFPAIDAASMRANWNAPVEKGKGVKSGWSWSLERIDTCQWGIQWPQCTVATIA